MARIIPFIIAPKKPLTVQMLSCQSNKNTYWNVVLKKEQMPREESKKSYTGGKFMNWKTQHSKDIFSLNISVLNVGMHQILLTSCFP